jgi:2-dehydro-3-deoxyphosphogluconate aldolase/(4S)-4-hydroxy-2-oxoglutarate aldolase
MPGALTPTEIVSAWDAGAHFVKLFPAGELGIGYIKAVRAPLHHIPMLAVGGVEPGNIADYLKAGISGFGVGSPLLPKADIERGNYSAITERARAFVDAIGRE